MATLTIEMPDLFTPEEAASLMGVGVATVYRWLKKGRLIAVSVDHRALIPRSEITRLKTKDN